MDIFFGLNSWTHLHEMEGREHSSSQHCNYCRNSLEIITVVEDQKSSTTATTTTTAAKWFFTKRHGPSSALLIKVEPSGAVKLERFSQRKSDGYTRVQTATGRSSVETPKSEREQRASRNEFPVGKAAEIFSTANEWGVFAVTQEAKTAAPVHEPHTARDCVTASPITTGLRITIVLNKGISLSPPHSRTLHFILMRVCVFRLTLLDIFVVVVVVVMCAINRHKAASQPTRRQISLNAFFLHI